MPLSNHLELIVVHDDCGVLIDADSQEVWIVRHDISHHPVGAALRQASVPATSRLRVSMNVTFPTPSALRHRVCRGTLSRPDPVPAPENTR